jgi:hypothetical protein
VDNFSEVPTDVGIAGSIQDDCDQELVSDDEEEGLEDEDSDIFECERIVKHKKVKGVTKYLCKWKGYPSKDNSWEPEEHILDKKLIEDYFAEKGRVPPP